MGSFSLLISTFSLPIPTLMASTVYLSPTVTHHQPRLRTHLHPSKVFTTEGTVYRRSTRNAPQPPDDTNNIQPNIPWTNERCYLSFKAGTILSESTWGEKTGGTCSWLSGRGPSSVPDSELQDPRAFYCWDVSQSGSLSARAYFTHLYYINVASFWGFALLIPFSNPR